MKPRFSTSLLLLSAVLAACSRRGDDVLARVDAAPITTQDLAREIEAAPAGGGEYLNTPAGKKELLELLVRRRLVLSEAEASAAATRPETRAQLARLDAEFLLRRQEARDRLLMGEYLRELKEGPLKISDADVKAAWATEKEARASHILVSDENEAKALRARIDKGEDFAALARAHSQDPTGRQGGDLGYLGRGKLDAAFEDALFALKVGEVAGPVASPFGHHIIKKTGERPLSQRSFVETEGEVRRMLENQRFQAWLADARKKHTVAIDAAALEKPAPAPAAQKQ